MKGNEIAFSAHSKAAPNPITASSRHLLRSTHAYSSNDKADNLFLILLDTGCSVACSGYDGDFCGELARGRFGTIKTADGHAQIEGFGIIHWTVTDVHGHSFILKVPGHYAPTVEMRLCSPQDYARYYDMVIDRMSPGGLVIIDNVLWDGKVINHQQDKDTSAIHAFNQKIQADERVEQLMLPVRDGILIVRTKTPH